MAKSLTVNAFFKTLMSIVNIVFPLLTAPYVARILSIDGYTEYNKAMSMIGWFSPFAVFGVYTYGMRTISQIKNDREAVSKLFTQLFTFSVFTSVFVTTIFILLILFVPAFHAYRGMYAIIASQLLFICFSTDWANEAFENYGFILLKTFFCRLLYIVAVFIFVKNENDVVIFVLLSSTNILINNFLTFLYSKIRIPFRHTKIKEITTLSKPLFIVFLLVNSGMLYTNFDKFMLTWFASKTNLTYYNVSQTIILAMINVTTSIVLVSIPRLSYLWANNLENEYYDILKKTTKTFMAFHTPCCVGMACIAWEVIYYYSGMRYIEAGWSLFFFAIRHYFSAFDMILARQVLLATGNEKVLTKIYYIGGIYNILCKIILLFLNKLTPELCILTTASADLLVIILQYYNIKKLKIHFNLFTVGIFRYLFISFLFIPVILIIKHFVPFTNIITITQRTLLSIIICSLIYGIFLIISKDELIYTIIKKVKKS